MLTVGSNVAIRNADFVIMDVTPEIIEDRIYMPIRFVCESIGKRVEWNSFNREVQIYDNKVPGTLIKQ
nr:copper amine oxidase N-terminal domain-containing protein [Acetivibrio clariflavus]